MNTSVFVVRNSDDEIVAVCNSIETSIDVMTKYLTENYWITMYEMYTTEIDNFPTFCNWIMQKHIADAAYFNYLYKYETVPSFDVAYDDLTKGKLKDKAYEAFTEEVLDDLCVIDWIKDTLRNDFDYFDNFVYSVEFDVLEYGD